MRNFDFFHPLTVIVFFAFAAGIPMFAMDPVIAVLSFLGAVSFDIYRSESQKHHLFLLSALILMIALNPLLNNNGTTVLFFINDTPISLEALIYGTVSGISLISAIYWFSSFSKIMTSDKTIYLFGKISPKIALLASSAIRFTPLFSERYKRVRITQQAMGLAKCDTIIEKIRFEARVLSIMITWATEHGIITAESMESRGFGQKRRTCFSFYKFGTADVLYVILFTVTGFASVVLALPSNTIFYPVFQSQPDVFSYVGYAFYALLAFLPLIIEFSESLRWKYLLSKI